jgi:hypothetical protein
MVILVAGTECRGFAQTALSVRGFILDPTGAGISGATVRLETATGSLLNQSETDSNGNFVLLNVPTGEFSLVVPAYSGFAPPGPSSSSRRKPYRRQSDT